MGYHSFGAGMSGQRRRGVTLWIIPLLLGRLKYKASTTETFKGLEIVSQQAMVLLSLAIVTEGNIDIARMELMSTVIKLQGTLIAILQSGVHSNGQVHLDLSTLQLASDTSRVESINSLESLFQRLSVVAPIQQNFRTITSSSYETAQGFCEGARILQQNDNLAVDAIATEQRDPDNSYKTTVVCKFCATHIGYIMDYKIKKVKGVKRWSVAARFIIKSHKPNAKYDCIWCQGGCNYRYDQLLDHVEECHGKADFVGEPDIALDTAFTLTQW
jgi:hypothetical protein